LPNACVKKLEIRLGSQGDGDGETQTLLKKTSQNQKGSVAAQAIKEIGDYRRAASHMGVFLT
jgi:hypothetical protein